MKAGISQRAPHQLDFTPPSADQFHSILRDYGTDPITPRAILSANSAPSQSSNTVVTTATPPATMEHSHSHANAVIPPQEAPPMGSGSSKKKKKKKSKQKKQAESQQATHDDNYDDHPDVQNTPGAYPGYNSAIDYQAQFGSPELLDPDDPDADYYSDEEPPYEDGYPYEGVPSHPDPPQPLTGKKKNKKKKKKTRNGEGVGSVNGGGHQAGGLQNGTVANTSNGSSKKDRIWNTSSNEERERIKEFWLSLGEEERRSLVKVEKEAVLKKMKEQQKHSCSCSVCGRKRTAIEEELEVLYDAYYEELEQYANQQQKYGTVVPNGIHPHQAHIHPHPNHSHNHTHSHPHVHSPPPSHYHPDSPNSGQIRHMEEVDDDDEFDDEEDDEEFDDDDEDDDLEDIPQERPDRPDFFNFGNSLTVKGGGILTVADDLLKNDGKKFIEMMEQLAERRMAREEEANNMQNNPHYNGSYNQSMHNHSHQQQQQSQYDDDEDEDEDYDEEDYDEDDDEDDEPYPDMTEEQRMEEGRRMFQIFAARMFEQRVLTAYREKVAQERQRQLLEELEEETRQKEEREQRKLKEKERRRDKRRIQRQAREEERLKKEAEKAAEDAAKKALEEKKAEEQRKRKEEQRQKREAEKRALEEEKHRKEEEKRKRIAEEKEREAERERKRKEHQERERKKREEAAKKAKEEKEAKEREAREKRERDERERRAKEEKARKDAEQKERERREQLTAQIKSSVPSASRIASNLQPASIPPNALPLSSPRTGIATPVVPKPASMSSSPIRTNTSATAPDSSMSASPQTPQKPSRIGMTPMPTTPIPQSNPSAINQHQPPKTPQFGGPNPLMIPHASSSLPPNIPPPPGVNIADLFSAGMPMGMGNGHMSGFHQAGMPRLATNGGPPIYPPPPMSGGFRGFATPSAIPMQSPNGIRIPPPPGRGMFVPPGYPPPGMSPITPMPGSPFMNVLPPPGVPINPNRTVENGTAHRGSLPTPIQRPQSTVQKDHMFTLDEMMQTLGSSALVADDDDFPLPFPTDFGEAGRRMSATTPKRTAFGIQTPFVPEYATKNLYNTHPDWSHPVPFSSSVPTGWTNSPGWSVTDAGRSSFNRRGDVRLDNIRRLACQVLSAHSNSLDGPSMEINRLHSSIKDIAPPDLASTLEFKEVELVTEVEGDAQNGGGVFMVKKDEKGERMVRFEPEEPIPEGQLPLAPGPGEIGSPTMSSAFPFGSPTSRVVGKAGIA